MLWPFNHFSKPRLASRGTIEAIYGMIVTQAREPVFYRDLGVPDTVNGRFDLLVLHLWLVLRRLTRGRGRRRRCRRRCSTASASDMDDNLREMGVGDLTVPKRMQAFGEAFYGRAAAYDRGSGGGRASALAQALCKNILNGERHRKTRGGLPPMSQRPSRPLAGRDEARIAERDPGGFRRRRRR